MGGTTQMVQDGLTTILAVGTPLLSVLAVVGLVVGVFQAATQINDPALGFLPRVVALGLTLWLLGPWMTEQLGVMMAHHLATMAGGGP